jgi:hypothetical protein
VRKSKMLQRYATFSQGHTGSGNFMPNGAIAQLAKAFAETFWEIETGNGAPTQSIVAHGLALRSRPRGGSRRRP